MKDLEIYRGFRPHRDFRNFADEADRQKAAWRKANLILSKEEYFDPAIKVYFEKIMQLCQDHGVDVFLLRIPMSKEFYEEATRIVPVEKLYREVEAIASRYSVYVGMYDYHDLYFEHPEYFFDPDHLNVKGSDLFTTRFAENLKGTGSGSLPE